MADSSFILVSMKGSKARRLAQAISNETSNKIVEYLGSKSATETEISKELGLPLSTVHYNLRQLLEAGLVKSDEYHYSKKGKEVNHYTLVGKYIIIVPQHESWMKERLKSLFAAAVVVVTAAVGLNMLYSSPFDIGEKVAEQAPAPMLATVADSARAGGQSFVAASPANWPLYAWFVTGAALAAAVLLALDWLFQRDD